MLLTKKIPTKCITNIVKQLNILNLTVLWLLIEQKKEGVISVNIDYDNDKIIEYLEKELLKIKNLT